ncbi:hypothetical protein K523DRAFT_325697 [Schizophyllum commune Tattone D]|nr:hypothetical protein K523DRAFT_325697 [Schizophyllum commune Tattone D]
MIVNVALALALHISLLLWPPSRPLHIPFVPQLCARVCLSLCFFDHPTHALEVLHPHGHPSGGRIPHVYRHSFVALCNRTSPSLLKMPSCWFCCPTGAS